MVNFSARIQGNLAKMRADLSNPVTYSLTLNDQEIKLNQLLKHKLSLFFTGKINCIQCSRLTNKSFHQGYCYPCFRRLQECNCSVRPENCRVFAGACDVNDWAHAQCAVKHYVYLANSSGLKVGITRCTHVPTRWIDQGASQACLLMEVTNRNLAGQVEVQLKEFIGDRTNWQAMLKSEPSQVDLIAAKLELLTNAKIALTKLIDTHSEQSITYVDTDVVTTIRYPVLHYPQKIKTFDFDKNPRVEGVLVGIKGQYLIFDTGVLNIRKFSGYEVELGY